MRMHEPKFLESSALYQIEAVAPNASYHTLVAGTDFFGVQAAWQAMQGGHPHASLRVRHGALVMSERAPLK